MMNNLFRKYSFLTVVALLLFASASFAQQTQIELTGIGDNATVGGVYVDPYLANVGGATNTQVICDDWSNNTYLNEQWTANITTMTSTGLPSGATPMFGNNSALYNEAAWLAAQLIANPTNTTMQDEISFALWELTYGQGGTSEENPGPQAYMASALGTSNSIYIGAQNLLCEAQGGVCNGVNWAGVASSYDAAGWEILTPVVGSSLPSGDGTPQEFLVDANPSQNGTVGTATPESSSVVLLSADMFGLLGLAFVFRRRLLRPTT